MEPLDRVRALYMARPDIQERLSHGSPAWFWQGKRCLGMFADHHHGVDWVALWVPCPPGVAAALAESEEIYFIPPYVGSKGWVGVKLGLETDWDAVEGIVAEAIRLHAGK